MRINGSLSALEHSDIVAHVSSPGHGKLLWDPALLPYGYASNTAEGYVCKISDAPFPRNPHLSLARAGPATASSNF